MADRVYLTYPNGNYKAVIIGHALGETEKGSQYVKFKINLTEAKFDIDPEFTMNAHKYIDMYLTEKTAERTVETLKSIGWDARTFSDLEAENQDNSGLLGVEVDVYCKQEVYGGKTRDKFHFDRNAGQVRASTKWAENMNQLNRSAVRKLDGLFLKTKAQRDVINAVASKSVPVSDANEDRVPF